MAANHEFPASASNLLIQGYCDDFVQLAATMAQTLEQVSMRELPLDDSREQLTRVERGMRDLADAIRGMLDRPAHGKEDKLAAASAAAGANALAVSQSATRTAVGAGPSPGPADVVGSVGAAVAARAAKPSGTVVFQGSTESMPIRSVLQFLSRMRKTGTLWMGVGGERLTLDLVDGCVVGTTSDKPPEAERLGQLLVERGWIDRADLVPFQNKHGGPVPIGSMLVRAGKISEGQLLEILELQVRRRVDRAVRCTQGSYAFYEGPRSRGSGRIRIRPVELTARKKA